MAAPNVKKVPKGEILFKEGDASRSMYFVQNGMIRLFKQKGASSIELGMIRKGEVIGEMGFLDGGPRSASAEALHETELVEITNQHLAAQLKVMPPWLIVLLKTVVNRLRNANNKIRQLESSSTALTYGSEGAQTTYVFLTNYDIMKVLTACLVSCARGGKENNGMVQVSIHRINKYAQQIMGIHENKISEMLDILEKIGLCRQDKTTLDKIEVYFTDVNQLEMMINYVNDENLKEHSKKQNFTVKGVTIMGVIAKHIGKFPPNAEGISEVNIAAIVAAEKEANQGKEPFRMDEFAELVKEKVCPEPAFKDNANILAKINASQIQKLYKVQKLLKIVDEVNNKKREQAAAGVRKVGR
ncbi:MAG: Crp/Fnr family transcriptional regulator [Bacteriovoracia bacterium]